MKKKVEMPEVVKLDKAALNALKERVVQLLEDARKTSTIEERSTLYREFQQRLLIDLPAIFLFRPISTHRIHWFVYRLMTCRSKPSMTTTSYQIKSYYLIFFDQQYLSFAWSFLIQS